MTSFESAYNEVAELVRTFEEHRDVFLSVTQLAATQRVSEHEQLQRKYEYLDGEIDRPADSLPLAAELVRATDRIKRRRNSVS